MKKHIGLMIATCLVMFMASNVYAASGNTTNPGERVEIIDNNSRGGNLVFEPSPTTVMGWITDANDYTLVSYSASNIDTADGFSYCAASGSTNIYKLTLENVTTVTFPTSDPGSTLSTYQ